MERWKGEKVERWKGEKVKHKVVVLFRTPPRNKQETPESAETRVLISIVVITSIAWMFPHMKKLIGKYNKNASTSSAMKTFSMGGEMRYRDEMIHIKTDFDFLVLLATQVFMEAAGCRFNAIRKMTVGEIMKAVRVPEPCFGCGEMTTHYRQHIRQCKKLKQAQRRGDDLRKVRYSRSINFFGHKVCMNVYISEFSRSSPHLLACPF